MRSVAQNAIYNVIYRLVNVIYPLITSIYVSRVLLVDGVGRVYSAQNIVNYFIIIAALGIPTYGTKKIAEVKENRWKRNVIFTELIIINACSTIVCTILYYVLICVIPFFKEKIELYAICGIMLPLNLINVDWYYQGKEEYAYIMKRNIVVKIISFVLLIVFVRRSTDYVTYALIISLATSFNYVFNIMHLRGDVSFLVSGIKLTQHLKPILFLLASTIAIEIYTLLDTTMLTFMCNESIVGYYNTAIKAIKVIRTLVTAVTAVFLPRLCFLYNNNQREEFDSLISLGIKILFYITMPVAVGAFLVADDAIIVMFGAVFKESIVVFRLFTISIVSVAISNFIGNQILITVGKERKVFLSTICGAFINVLLNFLLIANLQHHGAAIASVITELCVMSVQIYFARDYLRLRCNNKYLLSLGIGLVVMILIVCIIRSLLPVGIVRLVTSVVVGAIFFFFTTMLLKNDVCVMIRKKILKNMSII